MEVTHELLHELFEYKDGVLYWKKSRPGIKSNMIAGYLDNSGYIRIRVNHSRYLIHRLIYLMHYGYLPDRIDHKDNNPLNNRIENLREATNQQNSLNRKLNKNNTSGVKGVYWRKDTNNWQVRVTINGNFKSLGSYNDLELAELVANEARDKYHGEFANHGKQDEKVST